MSITISCRTNLDLHHAEQWPKELPVRPMIGDRIASTHLWRVSHMTRRLVLEVRDVEFSYRTSDDRWVVCVELHLPTGRWENLIQFYEWYAPITGRSVGAYI